ncbi:MAG: T9SS type A sorting domain-containing protein, partial [Flavobacteriaceae bacterium]
VSVDIQNSGPQYEKWNLVGNPYPSYINVQDFLNHEVSTGVSNLDLFDSGTAAIYGYDGDASNGWTIYNLANTTASTVITPGQGFFVSADATNASLYDLEFTPAMSTSGTSDDFISGRGSLIYFTLNASTGSDSYSTDVYFNPNASLAFNFGFDAELFSSPAFVLYSELVEINSGSDPTMLSLQTINTTDLADTTIPLGVRSDQGVELTFTITTNTLPSTTELWLDDTVESTSTLLNTTDYVVTPNVNLDGTGRFYLRVFDSTLSITESNPLDSLSIFALNSSKEIVIKGQLQNNSILSLYDIQGRKITTTVLDNTIQDNRIDVSGLSSGVYVVNVKNDSQQKSQKVIIK